MQVPKEALVPSAAAEGALVGHAHAQVSHSSTSGGFVTSGAERRQPGGAAGRQGAGQEHALGSDAGQAQPGGDDRLLQHFQKLQMLQREAMELLVC